MEAPLISIVLPTYNGSRYLEQSIDSCLSQSYSNWELLVVDDGSTDHTPDIVACYTRADHRIKSIRLTTNKRLPGALNTGFAVAQGEFLTWTSDDNAYRPDALSEMVTCLLQQPEIDVVYADCSAIDEDGNVLRLERNPPIHEMAEHNCIGACFLYRRTVHEVVGGYDERLFCAEDYDFWLRAAARFRFEPLHRDLYLYRYHERSLTTTRRDFAISMAHRTKIRNVPRLPWLTREDIAKAYLSMADQDADRRRRFEALGHVAQATRWEPKTALLSDRGLLVRVLFGRRSFNALITARNALRTLG